MVDWYHALAAHFVEYVSDSTWLLRCKQLHWLVGKWRSEFTAVVLQARTSRLRRKPLYIFNLLRTWVCNLWLLRAWVRNLWMLRALLLRAQFTGVALLLRNLDDNNDQVYEVGCQTSLAPVMQDYKYKVIYAGLIVTSIQLLFFGVLYSFLYNKNKTKKNRAPIHTFFHGWCWFSCMLLIAYWFFHSVLPSYFIKLYTNIN